MSATTEKPKSKRRVRMTRERALELAIAQYGNPQPKLTRQQILDGQARSLSFTYAARSA